MPRIAPLFRLFRAPLQAAPQLLAPTLRAIPTRIAFTPTLTPTILSRLPITPLSFVKTTRPSISSLLPTDAITSHASRQRQMDQKRTLAYGAMYQPSQRKRKRKHGFLSRSKFGGKLGRKTLARRAIRGRRFLSH